MMPSPLASAKVYGRYNQPVIGGPSESQVVPVPIVGSGLPLSSTPSDAILFELCDMLSVTSHANCRMSNTVVLIETSAPEFSTDPRLRVIWSDDGPADAAIGWLIRASFVLRE